MHSSIKEAQKRITMGIKFMKHVVVGANMFHLISTDLWLCPTPFSPSTNMLRQHLTTAAHPAACQTCVVPTWNHSYQIVTEEARTRALLLTHNTTTLQAVVHQFVLASLTITRVTTWKVRVLCFSILLFINFCSLLVYLIQLCRNAYKNSRCRLFQGLKQQFAKAVSAVKLLRICPAPNWDNDYCGWDFAQLFSVPLQKCQQSTLNFKNSHPSTSLKIQYELIILQFHVILPEQLTTVVNKT